VFHANDGRLSNFGRPVQVSCGAAWKIQISNFKIQGNLKIQPPNPRLVQDDNRFGVESLGPRTDGRENPTVGVAGKSSNPAWLLIHNLPKTGGGRQKTHPGPGRSKSLRVRLKSGRWTWRQDGPIQRIPGNTHKTP
jgi:hypothetical protein